MSARTRRVNPGYTRREEGGGDEGKGLVACLWFLVAAGCVAEALVQEIEVEPDAESEAEPEPDLPPEEEEDWQPPEGLYQVIEAEFVFDTCEQHDPAQPHLEQVPGSYLLDRTEPGRVDIEVLGFTFDCPFSEERLFECLPAMEEEERGAVTVHALAAVEGWYLDGDVVHGNKIVHFDCSGDEAACQAFANERGYPELPCYTQWAYVALPPEASPGPAR